METKSVIINNVNIIDEAERIIKSIDEKVLDYFTDYKVKRGEKTILILNNKPSIDHASTEVFILPPLAEDKMFLSVMKQIEEHLKK